MRAKRGVRAIAGLSGAQAAAADLARIRGGVEESKVDEAMLESARNVFTACDSYFKTVRTYPEGNPARDRFLGSLEEKLRAHLDKYEDLDAEITAKGTAIDGESAYEMERADQNLWYPLYRDGVRELTIGQGIARDELAKLFGALVELAGKDPNEETDDGEDDAVTMLWDLDLPHVSYVAIDTFVASGDAKGAQREERVRDIVNAGMTKDLVQASLSQAGIGRDIGVARRIKSIALGKADLTFLEQENLGALAELPTRITNTRDALYEIPPIDRDAFAVGLKQDAELVDKFLEAIVRALVTEGGSSDAVALCERIEQFFTQIVVAEDFPRATALRRQAVSMLENRGGAPARQELVDQVDQAMSSDAAVNAIVGALAKFPDGRVAEIYALIEALPKRAAPALVRTLGKVEDGKRRRAVCDVLAKWGPRALDAAIAVLPTSGEDYALDILYLLRRIGGDRAVAVLDEACRHGSPQVRSGALRLYLEAAPPPQAAKRARSALRDPDSMVRAIACDAVGKLAPKGSDAWLREVIHDDDFFAKADATEKTRLLICYAKVGGEAVGEDLMAKLAQRNLLFSGRVDEERAAAAKALAQIKYEPARRLIEKLANAKLARSIVGEACKEALQIYGPEPEEDEDDDDEDDDDGEDADE